MASYVHSLPRPLVRSTLSQGNVTSGDGLRLLSMKSPEAQAVGYAIIISKAVDKRATARNRTRRLIAASLRNLLSQARGDWNLVFVVTRKIDKSQAEIQEHIRTLLQRADIL